MRSVVSALGDAIRAVHLVVSDFPHDNVNDRPIELDGLSVSTGRASNADFRVAQTPRWLDSGLLSCRNDTPDSPRPPLQLVTHYEIFHQPSRIDGSEEGRWRNLALPSFNSKVIESRLGWIPRLVRPETPSFAETRTSMYCRLTTTSFCFSLIRSLIFTQRCTAP